MSSASVFEGMNFYFQLSMIAFFLNPLAIHIVLVNFFFRPSITGEFKNNLNHELSSRARLTCLVKFIACIHMKIPAFPVPPPTTTFRDVSDVISRSHHHATPEQHTCTASGINNFSKRRAHRLARLANSVHPRVVTRTSTRVNRARVTELKLKMTERREEDEDDADVVCAPDTPASFDSRTISEDLSGELKEESSHQNTETPRVQSVGIQTRKCEGPYMLKVFPSLRDIIDEEENDDSKRPAAKFWKHLRFLGRLSLSQFGLAWLLTFWTIAGAAAFYATEGPRERDQVIELKTMQKDLAVGLATELRQLKASEEEMEPLWSNKVRQYVAKHEKLLLGAVSSGYGEGGGDSGQLWTFPGCVLFAVSLITTLGFGAPVPRTTPGRTVAVIFAAIGIPAHFLLVLNLGLLLAVRLQRFAAKRRYKSNYDVETAVSLPVPKWVKITPFIIGVSYYLLGIIGFGAARLRPLAASLLFPLDFTAAGGLATTSGVVRIIYGLYLEGAVTIAAMAVAVLQVSTTESLTNIGLKYGLLTEA